MPHLDPHDPVLPPEEEPLLPQFTSARETERQTELHKKLHLYQCGLALKDGYMPSTDQIIAHLKWIMKQDVLNPYNTGLSPDGKKLIELIRSLVNDLLGLLKEKNGKDELQEVLWNLSHVNLKKVGAVDLHVNALEGFSSATGANAGKFFPVVSGRTILTKQFRFG